MNEPGLGLRHGLFRLLAGRDVAPGADDLDGSAVFVADEMLLVADPAVGAVLPAKAVFESVGPVSEKSRNLGLDAGQIVRVDAFAPEIRILEILPRFVTKQSPNVFADEGRFETTGCVEGVDDRRRGRQ